MMDGLYVPLHLSKVIVDALEPSVHRTGKFFDPTF